MLTYVRVRSASRRGLFLALHLSGEVYAAAQASTCCDVTGEESPNGAHRKMHAFCGVTGLEGEIKITRGTKSLSEACLNTTRTLTECLGSHTNAFLLGAKGSENDKGAFGRKRKRKRQRGHFPSCPLCKPQNSSYPHRRKVSEREQPPPCLRGQKGNVNKRTNEMGTSAHQKTRRRS